MIIASKHSCTATHRITFHWYISLQVSNYKKSFLLIRRHTEDIQHFTYNKCQALNADLILQKKDHISVVFIFNVPESNCFIILQSGLRNMSNFRQLNTAYIFLFIYLLFCKILYQHRSIPQPLCTSCPFQKCASISSEAVEPTMPFIHTN